jgi:tryptophanase
VDVRDARGFFPGLDDKVFLDAATVSLAPVQAREAIERFLERAVLCPERDASTHHIAIPRRTYTQSHIDYVIEVCSAVAERRAELRGLRMVFEPPTLRHFTARFEPVD